jgi:hypothetical protein
MAKVDRAARVAKCQLWAAIDVPAQAALLVHPTTPASSAGFGRLGGDTASGFAGGPRLPLIGIKEPGGAHDHSPPATARNRTIPHGPGAPAAILRGFPRRLLLLKSAEVCCQPALALGFRFWRTPRILRSQPLGSAVQVLQDPLDPLPLLGR